MPAVVKRSSLAGDRVRLEWLGAHFFPTQLLMETLGRIDRQEPVQPRPDLPGAEWVDAQELAFLFSTLELASAAARLLRQPGTTMMVWAEPRLTGQRPVAGAVTEVGSRRVVSKPRPRQSRRAHSSGSDPLERDWHQHAVNSGGND